MFFGIIASMALALSSMVILAFFGATLISPLVLALVQGMAISMMFPRVLPSLSLGLAFSGKVVLRIGVALYGLRITFEEIAQLGLGPLAQAIIVVVVVFLGGAWIGRRLGLDRESALLVSCGSAVCGVAAVLALESVLKSQPHKSSVAVSTVVVFGLLGMVLYPMLYQAGLSGLSPFQEGIYIGATLHEVANVVVAGSALGDEVAKNAVVIKMVRVLLLIPLLIGVSLFVGVGDGRKKIAIPWFAIWFIGCIGVRSSGILPGTLLDAMIHGDTFLLSMAMGALGLQTDFSKFRGIGGAAFMLAGILFVLLSVGGYSLTWLLNPR